MIEVLDANLAHFAAIVERDLGVSIRDLPGSGAAGGLGGGLVAFAGGRLEPGINLVIEAVDLRSRLEGADLCLTGEGALDDQSAFGKTAVGVGRLARSLGCPALALAGTIGPGRGVARPGPRRLFLDLPRPHHARRGHRPRRRTAGRGDRAGHAGVPGGADEKRSVRQGSGMNDHRIGWPER